MPELDCKKNDVCFIAGRNTTQNNCYRRNKDKEFPL